MNNMPTLFAGFRLTLFDDDEIFPGAVPVFRRCVAIPARAADKKKQLKTRCAGHERWLRIPPHEQGSFPCRYIRITAIYPVKNIRSTADNKKPAKRVRSANSRMTAMSSAAGTENTSRSVIPWGNGCRYSWARNSGRSASLLAAA